MDKRDTRQAPWQFRFWRFVAPGKPTECWEWQGTRNENGYGYIGAGGGSGGQIRAHRAAYTIFYGPIPDGAVVCHTCDNRACVNPDHLFAASQGENLRDMVRKGRAGQGVFRDGDDHPQHKYTDAAVRDMRELAAAGVPYAHITAKYGISRFYLSMIVRGGSRRSAGGPIRGEEAA
jgi:hypothetical protein